MIYSVLKAVMSTTNAQNNIIIDGNDYIRQFENFFNFLENLYMKDNADLEQRRMFKDLRNHMRMKGEIYYATVPKEYCTAVMEELKANKVSYIRQPDNQGNYMIFVKDTDKFKLLDAQKKYELTSTEYYKEMTFDNIKTMFGKKDKNVMTITLNDPDMALISKHKLYESGITFAEVASNETQSTYVLSPTSYYSNSGKDFCMFEMAYAAEQTKGDGILNSPEALNDRKKLASFYEDQKTKFAEVAAKAVNGEYTQTIVLSPASGSVNSYLTIDKGNVYFYEKTGIDNDPWIRTKLNIENGSTAKDISCLISKMAESMDGVALQDPTTFDPSQSVKLDIEKLGISRSYMKEKYTFKDINAFVEQLNKAATNICVAHYAEHKGMTMKEMYKYKTNVVKTMLENKNEKVIQDFLNTSSAGITRDMKEEWLDKFAGHFNDRDERSIVELKVEEMPLTRVVSLHNSYEKSKQKDYDYDNEKTPEFETV